MEPKNNCESTVEQGNNQALGQDETVLFQQMDEWLEKHYSEMETELCNVLSYPTLGGEASDGAPFGPVLAQALDYCLKLGDRLGFETHNMEGYVGMVDLPGKTKEMMGVLTHLDVVPAPEAGWSHPPFSPIIKDGKLFARGTEDDKGPMVASLYAMAAVKSLGIELQKTVRHIIGCNEESGFKCMDHYLAHGEIPVIGFSPDGEFPVVFGEKGIFQFTLSGSWSNTDEKSLGGLVLSGIDVGQAFNIVPAKASVVFHGAKDVMEKHLALLKPEIRESVNVTYENEQIIVEILGGKNSHACTPELGVNAVGMLLRFLREITFAPTGACEFIHTLAEFFEDDKSGTTIGVAAEDKLSKLTLAPTMLHVDQSGGTVSCDMRFPVSHTVETYQQKIQDIAAANKMVLFVSKGSAPLLVEQESFLVRSLLDIYRNVTGDLSKPMIIGGGTYARAFKNFVSFGPGHASETPVAHQDDEYIATEKLLKLSKIYARAIYKLAAE